MENSKNGRKRKRGPYKQWQYRDSGLPIPKTTQYELDHPEWKRARLAVPQKKKVLLESQRSNTEGQGSITSKSSDFDSAGSADCADCVETHSAPLSPELLNNDNITAEMSADFAEIPYLASHADDNDDNNGYDNDDESISCEQVDEEDLFELLDDPEVDAASNQPDNDDSPDESEDDECAEAPNLPLNRGDRIKLLLLLATKKRHNLSYSAAECVMRLGGLLSKDQDGFSPTKYLMKQAITSYSLNLTVHCVCPNCGFYLGQVENVANICDNCDHDFNPNDRKKLKSYFLYLSVKEQIKALLESGLACHIIDPNNRSKIFQTNYEDVFDGKLYKKLVPEGALSFHFFVDGLQVSSTSKYSAWPILLTLNELPLHLRRKFVMMASIWLDKKKPNINEYMKPFVEECVDMYHNGVPYTVNGITKVQQIMALLGVSDSVARPLLRNSKQFNGRFGCGLCYHHGYRLNFGRGRITSYSLRHGEFPMRSHQETIELARRGDMDGRFHRGIRGTSVLSGIPSFDIVHCLDLDIFHCIVNVAKRFTGLWIGKKRARQRQPYNVRDRLGVIDNRLLAITTTDDISRAPRSLVERSDFRGHEWFYWVVFYSLPVMKNILPARFLNHWALLVHGVVLLMQNSVAKTEVVYAGRYFKQFNEEIDMLYGAVHVTFNVHLLTHLENSVVNFAQPWTHSAFIFENFNGELKAAIKSSNGVAEQITKHMQLRVALQKMRADLESFMTSQEKEYLTSVMTSSRILADPHLTLGSVALLGEPKNIILSEAVRHALVRSNVVFNRNEEYPVYERSLINSEMFHSCNYQKVKRQDNSLVLLESKKVFQIQYFIVISNVCYALGNYYKESRARVCDRVLPHYNIVGEIECMLRCIPVSQFTTKLLFICVKLSEQEYLRLGCVNVLRMEMLS